MGLWYASLHGNGIFLNLVKGSVVSTVLQKCQGMFPPWPTREKRKCRMLLEEFVASFGFLIPKQLLKVQALISQRPSNSPVSQTGSPSCSSNLTNLQPMIMRVPIDQFWDQLSDLQSKASSGTPSHFLTGNGGEKKTACAVFGKWIQPWFFCRIQVVCWGP